MTELKTLKDMNLCPDCILEGYHVHINELRQEAIKWVKEMQKVKDKSSIDTAEEVFIMFFNLTEEELK